jgi:hypothetical protein
VGIDIRSISPAMLRPASGKSRRIEVKGRKKAEAIRLTENEWRKARQLRDSYWLYVVWEPQVSPAVPVLVQNPGEALSNYVREIRQISHYEIPADAIKKSAYQGD